MVNGLANDGNLHISRETKAGDLSNLVEESGDGLLSGVEGKVADKKGVGFGADGVTVTLRAISSASTAVLLGSRFSSEVEAHVTALEESTVLLVVGLLGSLGSGEVDVTETTGAAGLLICDDTSTDNLVIALELLIEDVVIDTPSKVTNPESGALVGFLGLGLLVGLLFNLLRGLSLLGRSLDLLLLLLGRLLGVLLIGVRVGRVRRVGAGTRLGIRVAGVRLEDMLEIVIGASGKGWNTYAVLGGGLLAVYSDLLLSRLDLLLLAGRVGIRIGTGVRLRLGVGRIR